MPRPNLSSKGGRASTDNGTLNPLRALRNSREQRRREAEESAAREITNSIAENQRKILFALESIDFVRSNLPKAILEAKTNPNQKYCDLERMVIRVHKKLKDDPQVIKVDIRQFDAKLLTLVQLLKQAVEQGRANTAYAASNAIKTAVYKIRSCIPQVQPDLATEFVKTNVKYLDQWIDMVNHADVLDQVKANVDALQKTYEQAKQDKEASKHAFRILLTEDQAYNAAYKKVMESELANDRTRWTGLHREIHERMVDELMKDVDLSFTEMELGTEKKNMQKYQSQINRYYEMLAALKIVVDPNLLNKFNESVDQAVREMAKADQEFDEYLQSTVKLEGQLDQLRNAPGELRAKSMAAAKARQIYEELMNEQQPQKEEETLGGLFTVKQMSEMEQQQEEQMEEEDELERVAN